MIKAVIFDFGNVICKFDNTTFLDRISDHTHLSAQELEKIIYTDSDLTEKYETGIISSDEFYKKIVKKCNLSISKPAFIRAYTGIFTPISSTIDLIKKIEGNYKIGLLSNTSEWDYRYAIKKIDIFPLFGAVSVSFKVQAMKPRPEIYIDMVSKLHVKPEECIYIDDIKSYMVAAKEIGLNGIHYTSYAGLIQGLRRYNLKGLEPLTEDH